MRLYVGKSGVGRRNFGIGVMVHERARREVQAEVSRSKQGRRHGMAWHGVVCYVYRQIRKVMKSD